MEWTLPLLLLLTGGHCGNVELNIVPQPVTVGKEVVMACISPTLNKWGAKWYMDGSLVYEVHSKQGGCSEKGQILDFKIKTCNPNTGVFKITKLNVTATLNNTIWHCGFPDEGNSSVETILVQNQPIVNLTITPRTVTEGSNLNMSCSSNKENDGVADWYIHDRLVLKSENKVDGCFVELTNEIAFKHLVTCLITENKIVLTIQNVPATLNNTRWHCDMNENQPSKKILLIISRQPQAFLNVSKRTVDFGGHVNLTCRYSAELAAEKITWTRNNITVTELRSSGENGCTGTPLDADFELKAHCSLNSTKFTLEIFDVRVVLNDTTWMCVIEGVDKSKAVSNIVRIYVNKEWTAVQVTETTQESTTSNYTQEMGLAGSSSPSYLIPVLVGLGVFILVVAAAATVVGYKRRAKPGAAGAAKQKQDDNANQPSNKESLVMQENELYCSSDNLTTDAVQLTQLKDGEGEMPVNYSFAGQLLIRVQ